MIGKAKHETAAIALKMVTVPWFPNLTAATNVKRKNWQ